MMEIQVIEPRECEVMTWWRKNRLYFFVWNKCVTSHGFCGEKCHGYLVMFSCDVMVTVHGFCSEKCRIFARMWCGGHFVLLSVNFYVHVVIWSYWCQPLDWHGGWLTHTTHISSALLSHQMRKMATDLQMGLAFMHQEDSYQVVQHCHLYHPLPPHWRQLCL